MFQEFQKCFEEAKTQEPAFRAIKQLYGLSQHLEPAVPRHVWCKWFARQAHEAAQQCQRFQQPVGKTHLAALLSMLCPTGLSTLHQKELLARYREDYKLLKKGTAAKAHGQQSYLDGRLQAAVKEMRLSYLATIAAWSDKDRMTLQLNWYAHGDDHLALWLQPATLDDQAVEWRDEQLALQS